MAQDYPDYASYCPDYAEIFKEKGAGQGGIPLPEKLDSSKLDYTIESLKSIDNYLVQLNAAANQLDNNQATNVIVFGGCYIGQVIIKNSTKEFKWFNYHDYLANTEQGKKLAQSGQLPYDTSTSILLVSKSGSMTLPLNKVARAIYEGPENNIHFYASGELK